MAFIHGFGRKPHRSKVYTAWMNMRNRCLNPKDARFKHYGARGITICIRWNDFTEFQKDVGIPPGPEYTLDRIDTNGNYEPANIRWATKTTQARNQRRVRLSPEIAEQIRGMYRAGITQQSIADIFGCDRSTVGYVVRNVVWK